MGFWIYDAMGGGGWREVNEWKANQFRRSFAANPPTSHPPPGCVGRAADSERAWHD